MSYVNSSIPSNKLNVQPISKGLVALEMAEQMRKEIDVGHIHSPFSGFFIIIIIWWPGHSSTSHAWKQWHLKTWTPEVGWDNSPSPKSKILSSTLHCSLHLCPAISAIPAAVSSCLTFSGNESYGCSGIVGLHTHWKGTISLGVSLKGSRTGVAVQLAYPIPAAQLGALVPVLASLSSIQLSVNVLGPLSPMWETRMQPGSVLNIISTQILNPWMDNSVSCPLSLFQMGSNYFAFNMVASPFHSFQAKHIVTPAFK